jgi:phosphoglycolate/pyridoxal phosphate phosphatase family enzyme
LAVRTFVFDLDGVVYRGEQPLPGAVDTIETLSPPQADHQVYFFTNNSSKTREFYLDKLQRMGIATDVDHIMTASRATALYLREEGAQEGLREALLSAEMRLVEDVSREKVDYVVVGIDHGFNFQKLVDAQQAIFGGAKLIATNPDLTFPGENGRVTPGNGALVAAVEAASGVKATVIGKPSPTAIHEILTLAQSSPENAVIVGDRLDTDVLAGKRIGALTVLVLTGITSQADVDAAPPEMRPDIVIATLPELPERLHLNRRPGIQEAGG